MLVKGSTVKDKTPLYGGPQRLRPAGDSPVQALKQGLPVIVCGPVEDVQVHLNYVIYNLPTNYYQIRYDANHVNTILKQKF